MPYYKYKCPACGRRGEVLVLRWQAEPSVQCGGCGATMKRVMSRANIHFKGKGFYATDHKKGKSKEDKA